MIESSNLELKKKTKNEFIQLDKNQFLKKNHL